MGVGQARGSALLGGPQAARPPGQPRDLPHAPYVIPGTDIAYGAIFLRAPYAIYVTDLSYCADRLWY
eukprot:2547433-Rhodomonas_salina.1